MNISHADFLPAPTDDQPAYIEHSLALTGLGPEGLLIALGNESSNRSVATVVREVERIQHLASRDIVVELCTLGVYVWVAHRDHNIEGLGRLEVLDPRVFVQNAWHVLQGSGDTKGAVLAACWLMRSRLEVMARDVVP